MRTYVAYNVCFKWILTEVCNKTVTLAKMLLGFVNKLKKGFFQWWCEMYNNNVIVEYKDYII